MSATDRAEQIARLKQLHDDSLLAKKKSPEDKREGTFLAQALIEADELGGRYKNNRPTVTGATPEYQVPYQPPHSPWASADLNGPDPIGVDIYAMEPVGSQAEIEQTAAILRDREAADRPQAADPDGARLRASSAGPTIAAPITFSPVIVTHVVGPTSSEPAHQQPARDLLDRSAREAASQQSAASRSPIRRRI
jgi:hypothetical protein